MPGLDPPAGPKPLRRGEGPGIHAFLFDCQDFDCQDGDDRDKPGHDDLLGGAAQKGRLASPRLIAKTPTASLKTLGRTT
jgi:hypothetical protein